MLNINCNFCNFRMELALRNKRYSQYKEGIFITHLVFTTVSLVGLFFHTVFNLMVILSKITFVSEKRLQESFLTNKGFKTRGSTRI